MSSALNPYADWFHIGNSETAPNNYDLLGLRHFESDTDTIELAVRDRLEIVSRHLAGPHCHLARRLKYEVESAKDCLLDPQQRSADDALLRSRMKPVSAVRGGASRSSSAFDKTQTSPRVQKPLPQASRLTDVPGESGGLNLLLLEALSAPSSPRVIPPFPSAQGKRKKRGKAASSYLNAIGIVMVFVPTVVTAGVLYWMFGGESGRESAAVAPQRPVSIFDYSSAPLRPVTSESPRPAPAVESKAPNSVEEVHKVAEEHPEASATEEATEKFAPRRARAVAPLGLPSLVNLPAVDGGHREDFTTLFPCTIDQHAECTLAVDNPSSKILGTTATFHAESIDSDVDVRQWLVSLVGQASAVKDPKREQLPVAEFAFRNGAMCFRWLSEGRSQLSHMLRNCLLSLEIDGIAHCIALRVPQKSAALPVDLERQNFSLPLESEWLPKATELSVEFLDLEGFSGRSEVPERIVDGSSKDLRIIVKQDLPRIELQLRLTSANGPTVIRMTPVIVDRDQDELPLTMTRLATMQRTLPRSLSAARESFAKNTSKLNGLQAQYLNVQSTSDNVLQGRRALMLTALEKEFQKVQIAIARSNKQIVEAQQRLALLPELQSVADQLHQRALIKYRVFFRVGGREVDVLRVE